MLGSDAPQVFNVPGFSIQHELKAMTQAGISNIETIRAGTINPAIFFKEEDRFGAIEKGLSADLILLNNNPLDDISAYQTNEGVMVAGKWLSKDIIEERLNSISKKYQE